MAKSQRAESGIYQITSSGAFAKDYGFRDQIRRSSVSVSSNVAEGFDRASSADFHRFVVIAKASCAEVQSQLYLALDVGYIGQEEFEVLMAQAKEVAKILGGLRKALQKKKEV